MFIIGDLTALPDAARVLKGFFRHHDIEPERPIGHWAIKRLVLDGKIAARRIGTRLFIPRTELLAAARHFGYRDGAPRHDARRLTGRRRARPPISRPRRAPARPRAHH